jgi:hypothetical protein
VGPRAKQVDTLVADTLRWRGMSVRLFGVLVDDGPANISVRIGEVTCRLDRNSVLGIEPDPSTPSLADANEVHVCVLVSPVAKIIVERTYSVSELGRRAGAKPFVLARPSRTRDYAVPAERIDRRNALWLAALQLPPVGSGPGVLSSSHQTATTTHVQTPQSTSMPTGQPGGGTHTDTSTDYVTDTHSDWKTDHTPES